MSRVLIAILAAVMITTAAPAPASAQQQPGEIQVQPPRPRRADKPPVLWSYGAVLIILAAVFGANTIPSKRGHQD